MILYHGSNVEVRCPVLTHSRTSLDFGAGFYLTTDYEQAGKWAARVTKVRASGEPTVSVFETDESLWEKLSVLRFDGANLAWLRTVVGNRIGKPVAGTYDVITGPVADDRTIDIINQYILGTFPEEIAIQLLLPRKFKDQWVMKTEAALSSLVWKEAKKP